MKFGLYTAGVRRRGRARRPSTTSRSTARRAASGGTNTARSSRPRRRRPRRASLRWRSTLTRGRDRRQRRRAHVRVGLRRQRLHGRDGRDGVHHVQHRRQPHREADGVRRQGRHRHPGHPGPGAGRRRPVEEAPGARVLQDRGLPARLDPGRASRRSRVSGRRRTGRSTPPRTASLFTADVLSHYDVVIFLSTTGDVLNAAQQTAFENFIRAARATWASTRPPTPSTTGAGTAT